MHKASFYGVETSRKPYYLDNKVANRYGEVKIADKD